MPSNAASATEERLRGALRKLGFNNPDTERAIAALDPHAWDRPIEMLLRETLRTLA